MTRTIQASSVAVILCAAALLGCSGGDGGGGGGGGTPEAFLQSLQGAWVSCETVDGLDEQTVNTISDRTATMEILAFESADGTCTGRAWAYWYDVLTFTVGAEVAATLEGRAVTARAVDAVTPSGTFYTIAWVDTAASPDVLYDGDDSADPSRDGSTAERRPAILGSTGSVAGSRPEPFPFVESLQGTWVSCTSEPPDHVDQREVLTFAGLDVSGAVFNYTSTDGSCTGTETPVFSFEGFATLGPVVAATLSGTAVTGAHAVDVTLGADPTFYSLVWVDTAADPDVLYTGDDRGVLDGTTPELRPTTLQAWRPRVKLP